MYIEEGNALGIPDPHANGSREMQTDDLGCIPNDFDSADQRQRSNTFPVTGVDIIRAKDYMILLSRGNVHRKKVNMVLKRGIV